MRRLSPRLLFDPIIALIATLLATAGAVAWNAYEDRSRYLADFRSIAGDRADAIEMMLTIEFTRQTDIGALFLASQRVEAQEFRDFVRQIYRDKPSGASSIAFVTPVERRKRPEFERALAADYGQESGHVRELSTDGRETLAAERPRYYPIRFAEPADFSQGRPGLDLNLPTASAQALERAIASGQPTVADYPAASAEKPHFRLMLPIYRNGALPSSPNERRHRLLGVSVGVYAYGALVEQALAHASIIGQHVAVFDVVAGGETPVHVYHSRLPGAIPLPQQLDSISALRTDFAEERRIRLADRTLSLIFIPARPTTLVAFIDQRGEMIALGGSMLAVLFAVIAYHSAKARIARRQGENQMQLAATVFHHAHEAILITDADAAIIDVNPAFSTISGYETSEVIGKNPRILQSGQHHAGFYVDFWNTLLQTGQWQGQFWNRRRDGQLFATESTISAVKNKEGSTLYYIGLFSDVTERKRHQERVEHLALYDSLTELPNRALALDRLRQALASARRDSTLVAVCFLDLDDFKPVNDELGHEAGDHLLVELSKRLLDTVREHDTVARLGGDEFLVLLTSLASQAQISPIVARLLETVRKPFMLSKGTEVNVRASIGVALFPYDAEEPEVLLRQADQAMYQAKMLGRNQAQLFSAETPQLRGVGGRTPEVH